MNATRALKGVLKALGLRRPLLRLFSAEYRRLERLARPIIAGIRAAGFDTVRARHANSQEGYRKYLVELEAHIELVIQEALEVGAIESPPLRVLDLGCGPGYFLFALRSFGHDIVGLDIAETRVFNDLVEQLRIPRVVHRVEALKPLPELGPPFDLITALGIVFDLHRTDRIWGAREWEYFLNDCRSRLRPGGRLYLRFNPATTREFDYIPDEVALMLQRLPGGSLAASKEHFLLQREP
jgi:SAM-dependent methyltransferase